jgi:hypothetical protein
MSMLVARRAYRVRLRTSSNTFKQKNHLTKYMAFCFYLVSFFERANNA